MPKKVIKPVRWTEKIIQCREITKPSQDERFTIKPIYGLTLEENDDGEIRLVGRPTDRRDSRMS